jgi:DnaJ-class molecular chaperone
MRKVITRTIQVTCFRCHGIGSFPILEGLVVCEDCNGHGTLSSYVNEEVDDGEDEREPDRGVSTIHIF